MVSCCRIFQNKHNAANLTSILAILSEMFDFHDLTYGEYMMLKYEREASEGYVTSVVTRKARQAGWVLPPDGAGVGRVRARASAWWLFSCASAATLATTRTGMTLKSWHRGTRVGGGGRGGVHLESTNVRVNLQRGGTDRCAINAGQRVELAPLPSSVPTFTRT